jgi:glycosyltransferase involved in cell wall biosynthesis
VEIATQLAPVSQRLEGIFILQKRIQKKEMTANSTEDIRVLLVIPTYNNRSTLRQVVEKALQTGLPVLVVNDGSTDGGQDTLVGLPVDSIDLPKHRGKGVAIRAAADWAGKKEYSHFVTLDADGQHDPKDTARFVQKIKQNPLSIVIGKRDFSSSEIPGSSVFGRKFSNFWIKIASGVGVADSQSGFRAYPVEAIRRIRCYANRYHYEVEILVKGIWAGLSVQSVDISVHYSRQTIESSHFRPFLDNLLISLTYTRLVIRNFFPWPHKVLFGISRQERFKFFFLNPFKSMKMLALEKTSAKEIGYAAALGIFLGTLPLIAAHMVVIIFVSTRLKLNRLIALNVSHLCAPPVVPAAAVEIGYFIRHGRFLTEFSVQTLGHEFLQRLGEYIVGAFILALPLGALAGILAYTLSVFFKRINSRREKMKEAKNSV